MIRRLRIFAARRKLERLVRKQREKNRNYLKHREAGKLGWKRRMT